MKLRNHYDGKPTRVTNCLVYRKSIATENLFFNFWIKRNQVSIFVDQETIAIFKLKKLKK